MLVLRHFIHAVLIFSATLLLMSAVNACAASIEDEEDLAAEAPQVRLILEQAIKLEMAVEDSNGMWQAAKLYCEASLFGSTEAQYRLGVLYAFGRGVPENRAFAAALFSLAAHQGHAQARDMLDTIQLRTSDLPACVTDAAVLPEKPVIKVASIDTKRYANIDKRLAALPESKRWIIDLVSTLAGWYSVDPKLILSIINTESNFNVGAKSNKAAQGLMQLIPATAERFNVKNAFDATQNIKGGIAYMRWLLSYYRGNVTLAVAAYNAGEGNVDKHKGIPPFKETRDYVKKVLELYQNITHPFDESLTKPSPLVAWLRARASP